LIRAERFIVFCLSFGSNKEKVKKKGHRLAVSERMKDDQRKGEGSRSDDGGGGLSFLLGLVFFSVVVIVVIISLSSIWVWDQSSSHGTC